MSNNGSSAKMTFFDGFLMCCGVIIGAGIFAMTGIGVRACGPAVPLAFLLGALYAIMQGIPSMVLSSAIPIKGGGFRYISEFVGPLAGFLVFWQTILGVCTLTMMGIAAGQYIPLLVPFLNAKTSSILAIVAVSTACFFNISISAKVQNIMVIIMFVALGLFVVMGIPHMKFWSIGDMFRPTGGLVGLFMGVNYVRYAALGGTTLVSLGDEVENPGYTIPACAVYSTGGVSILYALVAATAVGVMPWQEMVGEPLGKAATVFMPPWALTFFLVGGALFAVLTTFLGNLLGQSRTFWAAAEDGLLPDWFSALNKHGVPHNILGLLTGLSLIPIIFNASIEYAYAIQMAPGAVFTVLQVAPALIAPKRRPEAFEKAWFKLPYPVVATISVLNILIALYFGYMLALTLDIATIIGVFVFFGGGFVYYNYWKKRQAAKGIDLAERMGLRI